MQDDPVLQSILPRIEEMVTIWVNEALAAGCPYAHAYVNSGVILFKNYEGKTLHKKLHFREAFHKVGRLRPPFAEMTGYALKCALKDPRIKEWVTPSRWNSTGVAMRDTLRRRSRPGP